MNLLGEIKRFPAP